MQINCRTGDHWSAKKWNLSQIQVIFAAAFFHDFTLFFRLIRSPRKFLFYRAALSTYFLVWFVTQNTAVELPKHYIYLTTWGETLLNIYFTSAFGLSIYFYMCHEVIICINKHLLATGFKEVEKQQKGMIKIVMWICELFRIFSWDVGIMLSIAYWVNSIILHSIINFVRSCYEPTWTRTRGIVIWSIQSL